MNRIMVLVAMMALAFVAAVKGDEPTVAAVTNWQLQAVDEDGVGTYSTTDKVSVTGIILNNPEEMLDVSSSTSGMGGQWQVYIQGEGSDHAGTAIYMAQRYVYMGGGVYTTDQWLSEMWRTNHDPNTGYTFHIGDRVRVTGWYMFHNGKTNINEKHNTDPFYDFNVELVTPAADCLSRKLSPLIWSRTLATSLSLTRPERPAANITRHDWSASMMSISLTPTTGLPIAH